MATLRKGSDAGALDLWRQTACDAPEAPPQTAQIAADLETRGCPICHRLKLAAFEFLTGWQRALSRDPSARQAFVTDLGFCATHTWQLRVVASDRGLAAGYALLLERLADEVTRLSAEGGDLAAGLQRAAFDRRRCRACEHLDRTAADHVRGLALFVAQPAGRRAYARAQGVCLRHLVWLLAEVAGDVGAFLLAHAARQLAACAEDMRGFAAKHDALRRDLLSRDERDALERALVRLAGERGLTLAPDGDP